MRPRVLFVNNLYPPLSVGGAERTVEDLATGGADTGTWDVAVLTLADRADGDSTSLRDGVNICRRALPDTWPFGPEWQASSQIQRLQWHTREAVRRVGAKLVSEAVREWRPDLVSTHNLGGFGAASSWGAIPEGIPVVHTLHDYYLLCTRTTSFRRDHRCERTCLDCRILTSVRRRAAQRPNFVVGVSSHVLRRHTDAGLFRGVPTAVILNTPSRVSIPRRQVMSCTTLGFMGRLEPAKGLGVIIAALRMLPDLNVRLVVAGRGRNDQEEAVRAAQRSDPRIDWRGSVAPAELFGEVDLLLVPTQWDEPFGRVAAEARSCNLPVMASRVGGLREALAGYERASFVKAFGTAAAWARELTRILEEWSPLAVGEAQPIPGASASTAFAELFTSLIDGTPRDSLS